MSIQGIDGRSRIGGLSLTFGVWGGFGDLVDYGFKVIDLVAPVLLLQLGQLVQASGDSASKYTSASSPGCGGGDKVSLGGGLDLKTSLKTSVV